MSRALSARDKRIADYLKDRSPEEFDAFWAKIAEALDEEYEAVLRIVRSYGTNFDAEEVAQEGVAKALDILINQFNGGDVAFGFYENAGVPFLQWLLLVIGRPGTGPRSGVIGAHLQRDKREREKVATYQDECAVAHNHTCTRRNGESQVSLPHTTPSTDEESAEVQLRAAISYLTAREQFVLRLWFGLHNEHALCPDAIERIGRNAGYDERTVKKLKQRARKLDIAYRSNLKQGEIADLLDMTSRTITNVKRAATDQLNSMMAGSS